MSISLDAGKALDEIQPSFMVSVLERLGGPYLKIINGVYSIPTAMVLGNKRTIPDTVTEIMNKTRMSTLSPPVQYSVTGLTERSKTTEGDQGDINKKGKSPSILICR